MIQAIIFDFDGVLFDSSRLHFEASQNILQEVGIALSHEVYLKKYFGMTDLAILQDLLPPHLATPPIMGDLIERKILLALDTMEKADHLPAIEGVATFLKTLETHNLKRAVFSNGNRVEVMKALSRLDGGEVLPYFQFVTTLEDVKRGKPDPEGYLLSAKKLNITPEHCLVVEDSLQGIRAAKAAGMKVIGLATSYSVETLKPHVDFAAQNYTQALEFVRTLL